MKHMLSIAAAAFLACGFVGASASAGDCCNSCDPCSHGKKSFFGGGFFSKKNDCCNTYANDCCDTGKKWGGFKLFKKNDCNSCCAPAPVYHNNCCNACDSCDPCAKKLSLPKVKFWKNDDCCNDPCAKRLSLPKINFFKRGCGCETSCCPTDCCGTHYHGAAYGGAHGGVIVQPAPAHGAQLAPVPPVQGGAPAPAPAPVPVPAGS